MSGFEVEFGLYALANKTLPPATSRGLAFMAEGSRLRV